MPRAAAIFVAILVSVAGLSHAGEHTVTLQQGQPVWSPGGEAYAGTQDNHIYSYSGAADANYGRYSQLTTGGSDVKRLLVKFKVFKSEGGPVPDGAVVSGATLKLYKTGSYDYGPYNVFRVLKSWEETESSWNGAKTGDAWNSPGCSGAGTDRSTDPVATPQRGWDPGWMDVDVTGCVQAFSSGTANNGWLLVDPYGNYRSWASRDYTADTSLRPKLVVTYTGNTEPTAKAYALPSKGIAPFNVTFDASASEDVDGTIISYSWDFGDGQFGEGERVDHLYQSAGTYTATLTITDDEGGTDTKQFEITGYDTSAAYGLSMQEGVGGYSGCIDAAMYDYHADTNWYPDSDFKCGEGDSWRPVVRFKVFTSEGGNIPANAEILSATLCLYKTSSYSTDWKVWQLKRGFVENEVTWNRASTAEAWAAGGASDESDRGSSPVATPWIGWDPAWMMVDVTASLQSMSSGASNCGWLIEDDKSNIRWFASSENADTSIRPKLLVTYRCPPTAVIATTPDPAKGLAPCEITFDGSASADSDGTILLHYWDFGDGVFGEGEVVSHTYAQAGCYKATLTITDDQGASASASVYVGVAAEGSGTEEVVVQDGLGGYAGTEDTYLESWTPDTARGTSTALKYRSGGYHPLIKFTNMFSAQGGPVPSGRRVKNAKLFLYKSSAYDSTCGAKRLLRAWTEAAATWNKFDGTTAWTTAGAKGVGTDVAGGEEPLVTAAWDPGWVEFPVTSDVEAFRTGQLANHGWHIWRYWGNTNTKSFHSSEYATDTSLRPKLVLTISNNSAPVAKAEADVICGSPPLAVQFTGVGMDVDGTIASYSWDFGDGSDPSTEQNPVHEYQESGRYTATLTVTDDGGLTAQASVLIEVEQPYTLTFQEGDGGEYSDTEDTHIKEYYPTLFAPGGIYLETQSAAGDVRKTLIRFPNLIGHGAGQIPHDAKIVSAKLRLRPSQAAANQQIAVYRVSEGWSIPYASPRWTCRRAAGTGWSGGNGCGYISEEQKSREANAQDTQTIDGRPFPYEWDVTEAVQTWANDADTNRGLVVEALSGGISFRSSDHNETDLRPMLLITLSDLPDNQKPKLTITSPLTSSTKKAFIEGTKDPEVDTITLTAGGNPVEVTVTNPTKWFAFVERNGSDSVQIVATATDSEGNETQLADTLTYTPVDAASPAGILMQAGDSALMMVTSSHPDADSVEIDPGTGGSSVAGSLGETLEVPYTSYGEYTATVKVLDSQLNVLETCEVNVTAVSVTMKTGLALGVKQGYSGSGPEPHYEVEVLPASAAEQLYLLSENGDELTVKDREVAENIVKSKVVLEAVSTPYVQARLSGLSGRILDRRTINGFELVASDWFGNGETNLGTATLRMVPKIPNLRINVQLGFGATYPDGMTEKDYSSNELDEDGYLEIPCVVPDSAPDFETTTRVYQELSIEREVGKSYVNSGVARLKLNPSVRTVQEIEAAGLYGLKITGEKLYKGIKTAFDVWLVWAPHDGEAYSIEKASSVAYPAKADSGGYVPLPEDEKPLYPLEDVEEILIPSDIGVYDLIGLVKKPGGGIDQWIPFPSALTIVPTAEGVTLVAIDPASGQQVEDSDDNPDVDANVLYIAEDNAGKASVIFDIVTGGHKEANSWAVERKKADGSYEALDSGEFATGYTPHFPWNNTLDRTIYVHSWRTDNPSSDDRRIKVVIVKVTFEKAAAQTYGYDKYEEMEAEFASIDPKIKPGPDYDFISVEKSKSTSVTVTILGCDPSKVFFVSEDDTVFKPAAEHVAASPGVLQIDGQAIDKDMKHLFARLGTSAGPEAARLGVCVYKKFVPTTTYKLFHVKDNSNLPATAVGKTPTAAATKTYINGVFKQAVAEANLVDGGTVNAPYDIAPKNGTLDIWASDNQGTEVQKVKDNTPVAAGQWRLIHAAQLRWLYRLRAPATATDKTLKLDTTAFYMRFLSKNKKWKIEDYTGGTPVWSDKFTIVDVDEAKREVTLAKAIGRALPAGQSAVIFGLAGLSGDPAFLYDGSTSEDTFKALVGHEIVGHSLCGMKDIGPKDSIMFGVEQDPPGTMLRFRWLPRYYRRTDEEQQWHLIPRN